MFSNQKKIQIDISHIMAVLGNPLHFVTCFQSLNTISNLYQVHSIALLPGYLQYYEHTIPRSNFIQGSSGKIRFFVICALNISQISTHLAMSNGPSRFVRKNSHSITMEIFYVPSLSRLLVFSPSSLGPGWAGFLGNFGPH